MTRRVAREDWKRQRPKTISAVIANVAPQARRRRGRIRSVEERELLVRDVARRVERAFEEGRTVVVDARHWRLEARRSG
jgi:hypothetical protein